VALVSKPGDLPRLARALLRSGMLRPARPERLWWAGNALAHWGMSTPATFAVPAARHPDRVAVLDERESRTYGALDRRTNAMARGLGDVVDLRPGDTAGILCRNHIGMVEALGALAKAGVHTVLMNHGFAAPQMHEVVARERVDALLLDDEYLPLVEGIGSRLVRVWTDEEATVAGDTPTLSSLATNRSTEPPPRPDRPARAVVLTSGTTGAPKGAQRNHLTSLAPGLALLDAIPHRAGDTMLVAAPLFHAWGLGNLLVGLALGATVVLRRRFDAEVALAAIASERATTFVAVPVMLQRLLEARRDLGRTHDVSSLRLVPLSGSAIPAGLAPAFMDAFGDVLYNLYGSTEVGYATVASPADLRAAPGTAGRPLLGTVVRVLDERGGECPAGHRGEIFVRSPLLFEGYTGGGSKPVVDGAMSTGDVGHFDEDGRLFVEGRADDMVVSGGENVYPLEVEELLELHPDVVEVAVVGVADEEFGQRLKAVVVARPGASLTADDVRGYVRARLARYKVPRDVEFVGEIPRNATGKVLRRELA
jgi:fatty-acyl-CoA synthase